MNKFWKWSNRIVNEAEGEITERVLELDGVIAAESWFDDDITPAMFKAELTSGTGPITVWINSPGGDCIAASQIYSMLIDYKDDVTVIIDGLAASAASVVAMAGTKVLMAPTAMMMIHNPSTVAFGDHKDMAKAIEMLDEVKESIINAYEIKTDLPRKELAKMMDAETWMNAEKAVELRFADELLEDKKKKRCGCEAYSFSTSSVENSIMNKIRAKAPEKKAGRKIDDLFAELNTKKYI